MRTIYMYRHVAQAVLLLPKLLVLASHSRCLNDHFEISKKEKYL